MTDALLSPYRVIDLTGQDGWSCGRILGDLGAEVIKIEPPRGDPGRANGSFYRNERAPERNLTWLAYNANKRGITLNLESEAGQNLFRRLAQKAEFMVDSFAPGYLEAHAIGYRDLRELNSRLILTSITPFGQSGPYAHYRGSDLIAMAMSGFMWLVGEPGRPPLRVSLPQAAMWTGMYAAAGTLIAHYHRQTTGRGQQVDVSMQAGMLWALANAPAFWSLNREDLARAGNFIVGRSVTGARMRAIYPCRDGHINFIIYGGEAGKRSNEAMVDWMAERSAAPDWLKQKDWNAFNVATSTQEEIDVLEKPFTEFLAQQTKAEFSEESTRRGIMGYPVANVQDIRNDTQLNAREFWQEVGRDERQATSGDRHADDSSLISHPSPATYPGPFAKFSEASMRIHRRAPRIGEHNREIYSGELGLSDNDLIELRQEGVV